MKLVIALPVLNEELVLRRSVGRLVAFLKERMPEWDTLIVIADNGSTDRTGEIARELAAADSRVAYRRLERRGKGLAVRTVWSEYAADVYAFMDIDLSTDLAALPALVGTAERSGGLAVGSRFRPGARVERSWLRRAISFGYSLVARLLLGIRTADLPCGFKAAAPRVAREVFSQVRDDSWFFDSELAIRTERAGLPVTEIPVTWREISEAGRRSKVPVGRLSLEYFGRIWRLRCELGQQVAPSVDGQTKL